MTNDFKQSKALMRRLFAARLWDKLTPKRQHEWSAIICRRILRLDEFYTARTVMGYFATPKEPLLDDIMTACRDSGRRFAAPRINWRDRTMESRLVRSMEDAVPTRHNLLEAGAETPAVDPKEIDLILIPGLAFDSLGNRLGHGGGFYDRFLSQPGIRAYRVGVAFALQIQPLICSEPHDVGMDMVVTQNGRDVHRLSDPPAR